MQNRPTAAELLSEVARLLDEELVPATSGPLQHRARVAASLAAIVERELRLASTAADRERRAVADLLAEPVLANETAAPPDLAAMRERLADELRAGLADDPATARRVWRVLMDTVVDDLAIAKPGHDRWSGPE